MPMRIPLFLTLLPFIPWMRRTNRSMIAADVFAGLTGAAVLLPQAIAFSEIAGLPPQYGIYSAFVIPIVAALYGSASQVD